MKRISTKNFIVFFSLFLASCMAKNDQQAKIRIVDLQGKSHPVIMKTPELNSQALASQGNMPRRENINNPAVPQNYSYNNPAVNNADFGAASSQMVQQTLQSSANPTWQKPAMQENVKDVSDNSIIAAGSATVAEEEQTVVYDLAEKPAAPKKVKKSAKKISAQKSVEKVSGSKKKFFAQVGSFTNQGNADNTLATMKKFHSGKIEVVEGERKVYRVLLGPFPTRATANAMVKEITTSGHDAILVRSK